MFKYDKKIIYYIKYMSSYPFKQPDYFKISNDFKVTNNHNHKQ